MLADPTGAFTKVELNVWCIKVLFNVTVYSSVFFSLPLRQLTCYLTVIRLCRYLGTSDPRGNDPFAYFGFAIIDRIYF